MYQTWSWLAFLHWSYRPAVLQRLLPAGLPYRWSAMTVERDSSTIHYRSYHPGDRRPAGPRAAGPLRPLPDRPLAALHHPRPAAGPLNRRARALAAPPGSGAPAGREPDCGRRAAAPQRGAGGALVARRADQDQRAAPARTSLTSCVGPRPARSISTWARPPDLSTAKQPSGSAALRSWWRAGCRGTGRRSGCSGSRPRLRRGGARSVRRAG